jgi:hypothetical protein
MTKTEMTKQEVDELLADYGETYAHQAGIQLQDKPSPLYQLLVLSTLFATRIRAGVAIAAAREIFKAGWRTPHSLSEASWQDIVNALGRGHYVRYDESTATALLDGAQLLNERWHGDLRRLRKEADGDPQRIRELLQEFPRIGPVGAEIFCREAQGVWDELRPSFDKRALDGAAKKGLPRNPERLAALVPSEELPKLAAALVRTTL